jgi:phosphohistidine phosphatase
MKSLTLFRHAKTERESPTGRDFDRRLDDRGR